MNTRNIIIAAVALLLSLTAGAQAQFTPTEVNALRKLQMAEYAINNLYVDSVNMGDLTENAIRGMLNSLDPHSSYSPAKQAKSMMESLQGSFEGIGVQFNMDRDTLLVIQTITNGKKEKVGILAGGNHAPAARQKVNTGEIRRSQARHIRRADIQCHPRQDSLEDH